MNPTRASNHVRSGLCWMCLVGLVIAGALLLPNVGDSAIKAQPPAGQQEAAVQTATPKRQTLRREIVQPGVLKPYEEVSIQSKLAGFVEKVYVDIGDKVKKGQMLAKLWVPEIEEDLNVRKARIVAREADLKLAKIAVTVADAVSEVGESKKNEALAGVMRAEAQYARWENEVKRDKELFTKGILDKQTLDEGINQLNAAASALNEAKVKVATFEGTLKLNRANREKAAVEAEIAQANLDLAKAELKKEVALMDYATLTAPFDGIVTRRNTSTGHFVQPPNAGNARNGAEGLLVVERIDLMRVVIEVAEHDALSIKDGAAAIVRLPALKDREIACKVTRTSWAIAGESRTLRVELLLDNAKQELLPGMYANVSIFEAVPSAMTLPTEAILSDGAVKYCFLVENGKATRRNIKVGLTDKGQVEVLEKQMPAGKQGQEGAWVKFTGTERAILFDLHSIEESKATKAKP
jgi:HlyD family secretion protein